MKKISIEKFEELIHIIINDEERILKYVKIKPDIIPDGSRYYNLINEEGIIYNTINDYNREIFLTPRIDKPSYIIKLLDLFLSKDTISIEIILNDDTIEDILKELE